MRRYSNIWRGTSQSGNSVSPVSGGTGQTGSFLFSEKPPIVTSKTKLVKQISENFPSVPIPPEKWIFLVVALERLRRYNPESNVTQAALLYRRLSSSSLPRTLSMQYRHDRGLYTDCGRAVVWNSHWQRQVGPDGTESRRRTTFDHCAWRHAIRQDSDRYRVLQKRGD